MTKPVHVLILLTLALHISTMEARMFDEAPGESSYEHGDSIVDDDTAPAPMSREQRSRLSEAIGCKTAPTVSIFKRLNAVCEDCFQVCRMTDT